ncbi:MAG TPA: acyl carrier protein [Thermoanaerobaculia bacterium]|nr:acyl carrier protein [Thermoanaerobaculia bacterium]
MNVRDLIQRRAPHLAGIASNDVALGADGLGLDSIAIAEVLVDCERHFGVRVTDLLLEGGPVTVARIVQRVASAS